MVREFAPTVPMLGVCLGHQSMGEAFGARVVRAPRIVHGKTSTVQHDGSGLFAGLGESAEVTRYHSLIVQDLPPELVAVAWTTDTVDGNERPILMALRHREYPMFGVQFHPESIATEDGMTMLKNFLNEARAFKKKQAVAAQP